MIDELEKIFNLYNNENSTNDIFVILLNYLLCVLCAFIIKIIYENKSNSLSGKFHIGTILPIL